MDEASSRRTNWFNSTAVSVERYFFFSSLALIVTFAWMEPSGAAGLGFGKGVVFWTIQISILIPLLIAVQRATSHHIILRLPKAPWIQTVLSGVVAALLFVPIGYLLDTLFAIPDDASSMSLLAGLSDEASGVVVPVTVTWVALNAPWICHLDFSRRIEEVTSKNFDTPAVTTKESAEHPSRFVQELRSRASGDLISLSSELHYIRAVTTDMEVMFIYNLRDAIEELPCNAGVQIHRSHWVAKHHIKELTKKNGSSECALSNGKRLPVSRRKYSEVRNLLGS